MWLDILSDQLPVVALVSRYLTNKLIGREPIPKRNPFLISPCDMMRASGISTGFPVLSRSSGQVAHVLLTRSPLGLPWCCHQLDLARLACVKHAASVRPEPGSNSPSKTNTHTNPKASMRKREPHPPTKDTTLTKNIVRNYRLQPKKPPPQPRFTKRIHKPW